MPLPMRPTLPAETTVLALYPTVARWCARLGGPRVDAEEAAQDVMMTLLRRPVPEAELVAFAYGVTRNVIANHRRRVWWRRWLPGASVDRPGRHTPLVDVESRETARNVAALLEALTASQREVIVLCDLEERSASEVAILLGVPEGTVRSRLRLARAAFRELAPRFHLHGPEET